MANTSLTYEYKLTQTGDEVQDILNDVSEYKSDKTALYQSISDEKAARENADSALYQSISDEKAARENADSALSGALSEHTNVIGTDEVSGHLMLSDATDSESSVNGGIAATPAAVSTLGYTTIEYLNERTTIHTFTSTLPTFIETGVMPVSFVPVIKNWKLGDIGILTTDDGYEYYVLQEAKYGHYVGDDSSSAPTGHYGYFLTWSKLATGDMTDEILATIEEKLVNEAMPLTVVSEATDWNTLTTRGFYQIQTGGTNQPPLRREDAEGDLTLSCSWFLEVYYDTEVQDYCRQVATAIEKTGIYTRIRDSGTWSSWVQIDATEAAEIAETALLIMPLSSFYGGDGYYNFGNNKGDKIIFYNDVGNVYQLPCSDEGEYWELQYSYGDLYTIQKGHVYVLRIEQEYSKVDAENGVMVVEYEYSSVKQASEAILGLVYDTTGIDDKIKAEATARDKAITTAIDNLVNGAPEAMDTLKELADAIEANEDIMTALEAAIGNKVDKTQYASTEQAGIVQLYSVSGNNRSGLTVYDNGVIAVNTNSDYGTSRTGDGKVVTAAASETEIDAQSNGYKPITPKTLSYAVQTIGGQLSDLVTEDKSSYTGAINEVHSYVDETMDAHTAYENEIIYGLLSEIQTLYGLLGITVYDGGLFTQEANADTLNGGEFTDTDLTTYDCGNFEPIAIGSLEGVDGGAY